VNEFPKAGRSQPNVRILDVLAIVNARLDKVNLRQTQRGKLPKHVRPRRTHLFGHSSALRHFLRLQSWQIRLKPDQRVALVSAKQHRSKSLVRYATAFRLKHQLPRSLSHSSLAQAPKSKYPRACLRGLELLRHFSALYAFVHCEHGRGALVCCALAIGIHRVQAHRLVIAARICEHE